MKNRKMQRVNEPAEVVFDARGVPISSGFDDPYFSFQDGLAETNYVFLDGNHLPDRLRDGFHIAEIGFGSGLNFLVLWQAWIKMNSEIKMNPSGKIYFTSFEAYPMSVADRSRSLSYFPELDELSSRFQLGFDGRYYQDDQISLEVIPGDVNETLYHWQGQADAWFLDGFSPAKNPEAWNETLLFEVGKHTVSGGTAATFTAAGHVREKLSKAGFIVTRKQGFGFKRHMTTAVKLG